MDIYTEDVSYGDSSFPLSYDDVSTYEEQVATLSVEETPRSQALELASRISANKVYLPPESLLKGKSFPIIFKSLRCTGSVGKRKRDVDEEDAMEEDEDIGIMGTCKPFIAPGDLRLNALHLNGTPVMHLPTNHMFAYARHYNTDPVGLEWINDTSCVLVFATNSACKAALDALRKSLTEEPDFDDCYAAKPVPVMLWPPEDRINKSLGMAEGLQGAILVRVARLGDRKVPGAKNRSVFYQKHGMGAGKDASALPIGAPESEGSRKRQRRDPVDEDTRRQLDTELDDFLREGEEISPSLPPPPPSKMRSDYIIESTRRKRIERSSGLTLLERTSLLRVHPEPEVPSSGSRSRRRRGGRGRRKELEAEERPQRALLRRNGRDNGGERLKGAERPMKSRQELDDELEAFLQEKD
ncbi:hypothetical protein EW145_g760 [Phellinidium pouzarii]|uniref:Chromatin target of PRMT1 protein C-terminal domain-containing protein n=1 Tax=Phellinidium pouzarii TaxID=167371 RepID=A0A4S4LHP4_9AGAM|nr:hypothetical protein EW145_g760 [Phellinidium pouzarii]